MRDEEAIDEDLIDEDASHEVPSEQTSLDTTKQHKTHTPKQESRATSDETVLPTRQQVTRKRVMASRR